ncbi:hypothetical protein B4U79_14435 [Dinothrombium tinctorium]|uniref:Uncharacterized protein n=1 Tax=Dinothrombium tinctorium TaxID=1965070 RepID=A0A3S3P5M3_9ACAR|nr:hypothetical protein B4U79_14435 [Dinothrombium tinctorium]
MDIFDIIEDQDVDFLEDELASGLHNVNAVDKFGFSPILLAAWYGEKSLTKSLIKYGAIFSDESRPSGVPCDPLHIAARKNAFEVIKLLVKKGANVNAIDDAGKTPLWYAILQHYQQDPIPEFIDEKCQFLIDNGANCLESGNTDNIDLITIFLVFESKDTYINNTLFFKARGRRKLTYILFHEIIKCSDPFDLAFFEQEICDLLAAQKVDPHKVYGDEAISITYAITVRKNYSNSTYEMIKHGPEVQIFNLRFTQNAFIKLKVLLDSGFRLEINCFLNNREQLNTESQESHITSSEDVVSSVEITCYRVYAQQQETQRGAHGEHQFELKAFNNICKWLKKNFDRRD